MVLRLRQAKIFGATCLAHGLAIPRPDCKTKPDQTEPDEKLARLSGFLDQMFKGKRKLALCYQTPPEFHFVYRRRQTKQLKIVIC